MTTCDDARCPSAPLPRLRADTAERGTSRERHRWADVCGKCRVSQCGGRGGRRWEPSCASMAVVVTAVKVTCIRRLRRHHRRCRRRRRPPRALRSTCLPYDFALPNLILLLNVFERMTFGKSTTFCHGYETTKKSLKQSLTVQFIEGPFIDATRALHSSVQCNNSSVPYHQHSFARQHGPAECAKRLNIIKYEDFICFFI